MHADLFLKRLFASEKYFVTHHSLLNIKCLTLQMSKVIVKCKIIDLAWENSELKVTVIK